MADLSRDLMRLADGQLRWHGDIDFGMEAVAEPAGADICNVIDPCDLSCDAPNFVYVFGLDRVNHPQQYRLRRLPDDSKNGDGNERAGDRVGHWVSEPDA